jgi:hypothetical protein
LAQGQSDADHIEAFRDHPFFQHALDLHHVPSSPTLRQRLQHAASGESRGRWPPAIQDSRASCCIPTSTSSRAPTFRWISMSPRLIMDRPKKREIPDL